MPYPEYCIKGINLKDAYSDEGDLGSHVLYFDKDETNEGWKKQSINWQDEDSVIQFTLDQRNTDGTLQFRFGIAVLSRIKIDEYNVRPVINGALSYERERMDNNEYHGNLILERSASKKKMKQIAAMLLLAVERSIRKE